MAGRARTRQEAHVCRRVCVLCEFPASRSYHSSRHRHVVIRERSVVGHRICNSNGDRVEIDFSNSNREGNSPHIQSFKPGNYSYFTLILLGWNRDALSLHREFTERRTLDSARYHYCLREFSQLALYPKASADSDLGVLFLLTGSVTASVSR